MTRSAAEIARFGRLTHRTSTAGSLEISEIVVGKDILELISSAMYVDPMTIYREYLQNAADAIDAAKSSGILPIDVKGRVDISTDADSRTVRIRDNGTGVSREHFVQRLTSIGASAKRGTQARGFRGVGRLAGLGYAQEVIFRSRTAGEQVVSELRWDCRKLRASLRESSGHEEISELIRSVVAHNEIEAEGFPIRFFEVELQGIIRLKSDRLMSPVAIADYLSQVAPVPFSPDFSFGTMITEALTGFVALGELDLHIDGLDGPVYRPHRNRFVDDDKREIVFEDLEFVTIPSIDGDAAAIAWVLHHEYEGALPNAAFIKGLRLRSGNVQVGEHALLEELFAETRFNSWSVGEVHIVDKRIVPNGRRDHFEQNAHYHNLVNHLGPTAREISRRCRTSSVRRKWLREFELQQSNIVDSLAILSQGSLGPMKRRDLALNVEQQLLQLEKIAEKDILADDNPVELKRTANVLRAKLGRALKEKQSEGSPLDRLPRRRREMYEHMFELIYECSTNRTAAQALINRMLSKIKP